MQEQQVGECHLPLGGAAVLELADDPATDIVVQLPVALWASPSQVGLDHVPGEVVGKHACRAGLDEGEASEPFEKPARIVDHERLGEPVLSRDAQMRAHFKCPPMQRCRNIVE